MGGTSCHRCILGYVVFSETPSVRRKGEATVSELQFCNCRAERLPGDELRANRKAPRVSHGWMLLPSLYRLHIKKDVQDLCSRAFLTEVEDKPTASTAAFFQGRDVTFIREFPISGAIKRTDISNLSDLSDKCLHIT